MKHFNLILALILTMQTAFAGVITDDNLDLGKPSSSATKSLTFKGPTKKKLSSTSAGVLGYDGNSQSIGDGTNTANKLFEFNKGGTNPFWKYDFATGEMQTGNSTAISHGENTLKVGDGTNSNKVLKFNKGANSPEIRYNSTTSKLEFSNDASLYKAIGSGTGSSGDGGINLLTNPSFEDGVSIDWSNTGGTFTQGTYTNGTENDAKYGNFVATTSGQYFETALKTVPDSLGVGCMADIKYFGGSGNFKLQALDSSANVLSEIALVNTTSWQKSPTIAFPCPAAGATMRVRVISTAAGTIQSDLGYIGGNKNISQISQANLAIEGYFQSTPSCLWSRTSASIGDFTATAACPGPAYNIINVGTPLTTDTDLPQFTINNLPPGKYRVSFSVNVYPGSTVSTALGLTDGTTVCTTGANNASGAGNQNLISCTFQYTNAGNRTFKLQGRSDSGTFNIQNRGTNENGYFWVERWPLDSETTVTNDQSSWHIEGSIGGASITSAVNSTLTPLESPSLDLVLNSVTGSATAEIACSGTNPSTGLTCAAGNESVGIAFIPPYAGIFDVCMTGQVLSTASNNMSLRIVETPNNAQTILQTGTGNGGTYGGAGTAEANIHICSTFKFNSASKRTIRLMYESNGTSNQLLIDRNGSVAERDLRVTVRPALQNVARPVLVGNQVTSTNASGTRLESAYMSCSAGGCSLYSQTGGIASCTRPAAGEARCTFTKPWASLSSMACTGNVEITNGDTNTYTVMKDLTNTTASVVAFITKLGTTKSDTNFSFICVGQ